MSRSARRADGFLSRLRSLVRVESRKAVRGRSLLVGLIAVAAAAALTGLTHSPGSSYETAWTRTASALGAGLWAAEIVLLVAGTTAIAGEAAGGTLKMILPHAYRRSDWIVAKALVLAGQAVVLLLVAMGIAVASGMLAGGLSDVVRDSNEPGLDLPPELLQRGGDMAHHLAACGSVALASLVATAWLGLLVSCLFDGLVPALSTGFLLFLGFKSAGTLFGAGPDVLSSIYAWYPGAMLDRLKELGTAVNEKWNDALAPKGLRLAATVGIASVLVSIGIFSRRDLQS